MDRERRGKPKQTGLDATIQRIIDRIEDGRLIWIRRIQTTLELDNNTQPTAEDVERYVRILSQRNASRNRN